MCSDYTTIVACLLKDFEGQRKKEPFVCTPDSSLIDVMEKLVQEKVHRIFIVDENKHPTGVITMIDVINALLSMSTGQGTSSDSNETKNKSYLFFF